MDSAALVTSAHGIAGEGPESGPMENALQSPDTCDSAENPQECMCRFLRPCHNPRLLKILLAGDCAISPEGSSSWGKVSRPLIQPQKPSAIKPQVVCAASARSTDQCTKADAASRLHAACISTGRHEASSSEASFNCGRHLFTKCSKALPHTVVRLRTNRICWRRARYAACAPLTLREHRCNRNGAPRSLWCWAPNCLVALQCTTAEGTLDTGVI